MGQYRTVYSIFIGDEATGKGVSFSTSNKVTLAENADLEYQALINEFNNKKKIFARVGNVTIIKSTIFFPGKGRNNIGGFKNKK